MDFEPTINGNLGTGSEMEVMQLENEQLLKQLEDLGDERDHAVDQLDRIREGLIQAQSGQLGGDLRAAFSTFTTFEKNEDQELMKENQELNDCLHDAEEELRDLKLKIERMDREKRLMEATHDEEEQSHEQGQAELKSARSKIAILEESARKTSFNEMEFEQRVQALTTDLKHSLAEQSTLQRDLDHLITAETECRMQLGVATTDVTQLKEKLAHASDVLEDANRRITGAEGERDASRQAVDQVRTEMERLVISSEMEHRQFARARIEELDNANSECQKLERELERVKHKLGDNDDSRSAANVDVQMEYMQARKILLNLSETDANIKLSATAGLAENVESLVLFCTKISLDPEMRRQYMRADEMMTDLGETESNVDFMPSMMFADKLQMVVENFRTQQKELAMNHDDADLLATALSKNDDLEGALAKANKRASDADAEKDSSLSKLQSADAKIKTQQQIALKNLTKLEAERAKSKKVLLDREGATKTAALEMKAVNDKLENKIRELSNQNQLLKDEVSVKRSEVVKLVAGAKIEIEQLERDKTNATAQLQKAKAMAKVSAAVCCCENRYNGRYLGQVPIPNNRPDQEILWSAIDTLKIESAKIGRIDVTVMTVPGHSIKGGREGKRWPKMLQMATQSGRFSLSQPFHQILSVGQVEKYVIFVCWTRGQDAKRTKSFLVHAVEFKVADDAEAMSKVLIKECEEVYKRKGVMEESVHTDSPDKEKIMARRRERAAAAQLAAAGAKGGGKLSGSSIPAPTKSSGSSGSRGTSSGSSNSSRARSPRSSAMANSSSRMSAGSRSSSGGSASSTSSSGSAKRTHATGGATTGVSAGGAPRQRGSSSSASSGMASVGQPGNRKGGNRGVSGSSAPAPAPSSSRGGGARKPAKGVGDWLQEV